jgi:hypothetical protein
MKPLTLAFIAAGVAVLAGLFFVMKPADAPTGPALAPDPLPIGAETLPPETAPPAAEPLVAEYRLERGQRVEGPEVIRARQGDLLGIDVTSDQADELHLHGYDLSADLKPGEPARLRFSASLTGRFELELHHHHTVLAVLEVLPQ